MKRCTAKVQVRSTKRLPSKADCATRRHNRNASVGNLRPGMGGRAVQQGSVCGERGKSTVGKMRYAPMLPELDGEVRRFSAGTRRNERAAACRREFRRPARKGGDLYELAKILGHSNIKMTERYAKLAWQHIARTGSTAREIGKQMEGTCDKADVG